MADKEALLKEFESVRVRYLDLVNKLVEMKVPGAFNPVASTCDHGTVCHGGGAKGNPIDMRSQPGPK